MSKFYTFVDEMENAIFQRYYDENGNEVISKHDTYNYQLYVEHPKGDSDQITLKNGKLKEITFNKVNDMRQFFKENKDLMTIHGNDSAVHQFIAKEYQGDVSQTCNVRILNYDIEVAHGENTKAFADDYIISLSKGSEVRYETIKEVREHYDDYKDYKVFDICQNDWFDFYDTAYFVQELGFSNPIDADQEIITISAKLFGDHPFHTFGTKPLEEYDNPNGVYIQCKDEKDLLAKFIKYWRDSNPQYITGWNIESFDNVYLINRIINVLGEKVSPMLSPFYGKVRNNSRLIKEKKMDNGQVKYEIFGITTFDYIELYKKYNPDKQESYKLDHIGEVEIKQRKVNYDEYGRNLMKMYNGSITVDMISEWDDLDEIMRYARAKELIKNQLKAFGYEKEYGTTLTKININKVNFNNLSKLNNDQLKGIYNYCDERVKTLSYKKFISYNEQDANIVELIDIKKSFIKLGIRIGHMSKSRMREIFGTVSPWDNMIYSRLLVNNRQIPPKEHFDKSEKFAGAYVKDPIIGKHKWLVSFDFKSLYPSIIRMLNMSPETIIKGKDNDSFVALDSFLNSRYNNSNAKSKGYVTAANGSIYDQSFEGVLAETMRYLMDGRDDVKGEMKNKERELQDIKQSIDDNVSYNDMNPLELTTYKYKLEEEISMMDATQLALKILANSGYGAVGNASFRYFRLDVAEGITLTGQLALRYVSAAVDEYMNKKCGTKDVVYAIYGDTDSIYCSIDPWVKMQPNVDFSNVPSVIDLMDDFVNKDLSPFICARNEELSDMLGAKKNMLIMKREALADTALFRGKKNYIIQVYDNEFVRYQTPKLKMMGVETAKTSTARIVRDKLSECLNIVINDEVHKSHDLKDIVDNFRDEFNNVEVMRIASPRGVKDIDKWLDPFGNILSGCPIHVRASINYNNFVNSSPEMKRKYDIIRNGDKIKFVKLKMPNHFHTHVVAFLDDEIPPEMELDQFVDRKTQFEDTFMSPLESFSKLVGWDIRRTFSMDDLFGGIEATQVQSTDIKKKKKDKVIIKNYNTIDDLF